MPRLTVKLYSALFKLSLKRRLETLAESSVQSAGDDQLGVTSRPDETVAAANPTFANGGVATKDIHVDPLTSLSLRIFLPDTVVAGNHLGNSQIEADTRAYGGYSPAIDRHRRSCRKLPVILQFHGGAFVSGSNDTVANDLFCRRIAKSVDAIVIAVGYRLAPESRYPAAFEDGIKALNWLGKQANLAECIVSGDVKRLDVRRQEIVNWVGTSMVEPWLAAHGDPSRCVLLGVSCGANIANYVAQKAVDKGRILDPVRVVAQVLMYPFFIGSTPTHSEIRLANSYFYDKTTSILAWKLLFSEKEFDLDHPVANPLVSSVETPLKCTPPTLTVVAEHDWMRDRAIAYSEELRKVNIDAPVLDYKDAVHEFATLDVLLKTPQAQACTEDIAIWVKKFISLRGHELSY
ncbi:Carboxylesterase [Bertholletia excelsa]